MPRTRTSRRRTTGFSNAACPRAEHPNPMPASAVVTTITPTSFLIVPSHESSAAPLLGLLARPSPEVLPPCQSFGNFLLESEWTRLVKPRAAQTLRKILLRDICLRRIVRVL